MFLGKNFIEPCGASNVLRVIQTGLTLGSLDGELLLPQEVFEDLPRQLPEPGQISGPAPFFGNISSLLSSPVQVLPSGFLEAAVTSA